MDLDIFTISPRWGEYALPGERIVYASSTRHSRIMMRFPKQHPTTRIIRQLSDDGWVDLVQVRVESTTNYVAIKRNRRNAPLPHNTFSHAFYHGEKYKFTS